MIMISDADARLTAVGMSHPDTPHIARSSEDEGAAKRVEMKYRGSDLNL